MIKLKQLILAIMLLVFSFSLLAVENADIIVAQDGSGDYTTVQDAIDSVPVNNNTMKIILIKNGDYEELITIPAGKNNIALVGEDRENTRIYYNLPREGEDYDDNHRAPITIYAQDIIIANMTIENTQTERGIHAFTIYGGGDVNRVATINCNILSYGGDTVSLWNEEDGMYYHRDCRMRGAVDFLCPRGWAYAENIDFYVTRETAVLWQQGSEDKDQKFVVKNSTFDTYDGDYEFDLARHHYDAAFYLINNVFSEKLKDKPIYRAEPDDAYQWEDRNYFYNNRRIGGNYEWFKNNLQTAEGRPAPSDITPVWTFDNQWDPRAWMPAVLPFADWEIPRDSSIRVDLDTELSWIPGRNAESHNVYFGTNEDPAFHSNVSSNSFDPGQLEPHTNYYWRVDVVTETDTIAGEVWHFHTRSKQKPEKATSPAPQDGASIDPPVDKLAWKYDSLTTDTAKVYLGQHPDSLQLVNVYPSESFDPDPLTIGLTYYWRVDLVNQQGVTKGDVWQFKINTYGYSYSDADYFQSQGEDGLICIEAEHYSDSTIIGEHKWELVDSVENYSGDGAMQVIPADGKRIFHKLYEKSSRLDYVVNFENAGKHYIWVRQYNPESNDQFIHLGLNYKELDRAKMIGDYDTLKIWEWASYDNVPTNYPEYYTPVKRTFDVPSRGVQIINLWYGSSGNLIDKIVLTTNPELVPEGQGPQATTDVEDDANNPLPEQYELKQNYPNPFNPMTNIGFDLPERASVKLTIYDLQGQKVRTLVDRSLEAGNHKIKWIPKGAASGIYFYRLETDNFIKTRKMVLVK